MVHVTFFDLEDTFGSIPHDLILHSLRRNQFPPIFVNYINFHYQNLESCIVTNNWQTKTFSFKRGVVQGCLISPIIFLVTLNLIIQCLNDQKHFRFDFYKIDPKLDCNKSETRIIILPFADDFCLITKSLNTQCCLIHEVNLKVKSMGLQLKPWKYCTFSIPSRNSKAERFFIEKPPIPNIQEEEQKFLG